LEGVLCPLMVYSDHQNFEYFRTTNILHRRHCYWAQELVAYDFNIVFHSDSQTVKQDTLSWHLAVRPQKGETEVQPIITILCPKNVLQNNNEETGIISASKLSKRLIKWSIKSLEKVRSEEIKVRSIKRS
jgi:hypothetical protein